MSDVSRLLDEYLGAGSVSADKQARVASAASTKQAQLGGYREGATADVDLYQDPSQQDVLDIANTPVLDLLANSVGRSQYIQDATATRSVPEGAGDSVVDVINGALQGALGIGAMGAGLVNDKAGTAVAGFAQDTGEFLHGMQTDAINDRRRAHAERSSVTQEHNAELREQEIADGSSEFMATARQMGRDFLDGISNQDSVTFQSGTSQGIGSLLVGGVIGKGLKAAGGAAAARVAVGRAGPSQAAFQINRVTNAGAMPAAIGALEGGGAYTQTVNEVMAMDHEQLLKTSPDYAELIQMGWDPKDAKAEVANHAGLLAGAVQAPVGVATGALVSKFEAAPFSVPSLKTAVGNVAKETVEEGLQSGSGEISSNLGIRTFADENRELTEGVGLATAEGALYGMGTAGVVQTPGAALNTAVAAIKAPISLVQKGVAAVGARGERVERQAEAEVENQINTAMDTAVATADAEVRPTVEAAIEETIDDPIAKDNAQTAFNRLIDNMGFDPGEVAGAPQEIQDAVAGASDRFSALRQVAAVAQDETASPAARLNAGVWLAEQLEINSSLFNDELAAALDELPTDHAARQTLEDLKTVVASVQDHPAIKRAVKAAQQLQVDLKDIQDPSSAEFSQAVQTALKAVEVLPETANLEVNKKLLAHIGNGDIEVTPEQRKALEASTAQLEIAQQKLAEAEKLNVSRKVSDQIRTDETDVEHKSAVGHLKGIVSAYTMGRKDVAKERLRDLMLFAEHMQNKVAALNEHVRTGKDRKETAVPYKSLVAATRRWIPADPKFGNTLWVNRFGPASVRNAQAIALDAVAVTTLANKLAALYPELGIKPLEPVRLDPVLHGPAEEVKQRAIAERRSGRAAQTEPTAPEADAQPVAASDKAQEKQSSNPTQDDQKSDQPEERAAEQDPAAPEQSQDEPAREQTTESETSDVASPEEVRSETTTTPEAKEFQEEDGKSSEQAETQAEAEAVEPAKPEASAEPDEAGDTAGEVDTNVNDRKDPTDIGAVYPNLIENLAKGVRNMFKKAYSLPKTAKSRMVGMDNPIRVILDALASQNAFEKHGAKLQNKLKPQIAAAYQKLLVTHGAKVFVAWSCLSMATKTLAP